MKILTVLSLSAMALIACSSNQNAGQADSLMADSVDTTAGVNTAAVADHCFLHTDGTAAQDSTKVHLIINGNAVTGDMQWLPKEKDSRKGTLEGTRNGDAIKATWRFMQEGMADSVAVEFEIKGDKLAQKPFKVNTQDGRQQTDTGAAYTVAFTKVDCR